MRSMHHQTPGTDNTRQPERQNFDPWATATESSLYYIFNTLPSPSPSPTRVPDRYTRLAMRELLDERYETGLKSRLYPYQRRTIAAMLEREASVSTHLDPRLERRTSPDGSVFYYSPQDLVFLREPRMYESTKSGVLAETMGLGKTHHLPFPRSLDERSLASCPTSVSP